MKFILIVTCIASVVFGGDLLSEEKDLNHYYEISKQNCQDISSIRKEIDRINNDILRLLTERSAYVKRAGDLKSKTTKLAEDLQRVADQERALFDKSIEVGLPTEISLPVFKVIVETSIQFQQQYIDHLLLEGP
jgi:isochorismate pyruvate lyase